tara:strand:+ start:120 stop:2309 length:2190 start_codon:yes stop_codon:yes gene_type:complete
MAQTKTINLDVNTNTKDVQEQFNSLRKGIKETTEAIEGLDKSSKTYEKDLKNLTTELTELEQVQKDLRKTNTDLGASFEDIAGEVQPLTGRMGEMEDRLYELGLAGKQNTKEFKDLLQEVGKYRKVQIETDLAVDAAAGTMSQKLGGALQGATSGFAAVQGAMGLFGTESEEVEAALLKVNSAMAIADGVRGIQEGAKAMKAMTVATNLQSIASKAQTAATYVQATAQGILNAVMMVNPINLIIVSVVTVIGLFAAWFAGAEKLKDGLMAVTDWLGITDSEAEEMAAKREQEAETQKRLQEAEQKRAERLHNSKMSDLDNEIALARAQGKDTTQLQKKKLAEEIKIKKAKLATLMVEKQKLEALKSQLTAMAAQTGIVGVAGKAGLKQLAEREEQTAKLQEEINKLETDLKIVDIEFEKRSKSRSSSAKKQKISDLEFERKIQDLQLSQLEKTTENEIKILKVKYDRIIEDTKLNESLKEEQKTAIIIEQEKIRDNEINKIRLKSTENLLKLETKSIEDIKPITELKLKEQKEYYDKVDEIAAKSGLKRKEVEEELKNASFSIAQDTLSLVSELNSLFASENEENAKKAFKIDKATKLASATIAGVQATIEAFKTASASPITIGFPAYPFIQAGLAGTFAAANIAKISKSKFQGGAGAGDLDTGGGGAGGAGGGGASATPTAQFNVVGDSGINQLAELQNQQPTKAFVVSGEVTTAQSLDRNRVQNATL